MRGNDARLALLVIVVSFENNDPVPLPASIRSRLPSRCHRPKRTGELAVEKLRCRSQSPACGQGPGALHRHTADPSTPCHPVAVEGGFGTIEGCAALDSLTSERKLDDF